MKITNSKSKEIEIFIDSNTNKYLGFAGSVEVYEDFIFIDTRNGIGYDKAMLKFEKLVKFLGSKYRFRGLGQDDIKQHISMRILEGIPKYDPRKETKLSTFIQMRVNRRLINELRDDRHSSKNATFLNINSYNYLCACGNSFNAIVSENELINQECPKCGVSLLNSRKISIGFSEVSLDNYFSTIKHNQIDNDSGDFEFVLENKKALTEDDLILKHDMERWLDQTDQTTSQLIELVLDDNNVSEAADKIKLSNASANLKIKNLRNNKKIRDVLGI